MMWVLWWAWEEFSLDLLDVFTVNVEEFVRAYSWGVLLAFLIGNLGNTDFVVRRRPF